ncbi:MAG: hypothetical protein OXG81_00595 [Acidobacteria bacterium]|nr:hypothetical protein [Acidobacteriota bacterium]
MAGGGFLAASGGERTRRSAHPEHGFARWANLYRKPTARSDAMSSACREPRRTGVALWVRGPSGPHARSGVMSAAWREARRTGAVLWVRGPSGPHQARRREAASPSPVTHPSHTPSTPNSPSSRTGTAFPASP